MAFFEERKITLTKAGKILGGKYDSLPDKEIENLLDFIYNLCTKTIKEVLEKKYGTEKMSNLL